MKNDIKVGSYVFRPYSQTYWQIKEMYYRTMPMVYSAGGAKSCEVLCVTAVKVLEKSLSKPQKNIIVRDHPIACFSLLTPEWYKEKLYYQKKGVLWDLICRNNSQKIS